MLGRQSTTPEKHKLIHPLFHNVDVTGLVSQTMRALNYYAAITSESKALYSMEQNP